MKNLTINVTKNLIKYILLSYGLFLLVLNTNSDPKILANNIYRYDFLKVYFSFINEYVFYILATFIILKLIPTKEED